ncbi:MAG: hypothetical protein BM485_15755 [Desulfobulbaceae bacterium DB1]|nr:MAG: hypothetical protein BM485_15755 [Desulfobulbaceae bacterium DB1]
MGGGKARLKRRGKLLPADGIFSFFPCLPPLPSLTLQRKGNLEQASGIRRDISITSNFPMKQYASVLFSGTKEGEMSIWPILKKKFLNKP